MRETDATGSIYFTSLLEIALEAFEAYLDTKWSQGLQHLPCLLPIVHTEADFFSPISFGDLVVVHWQVDHVGKSSFCHHSVVMQEKKKVGTVKIIHAAVSKKTRQAIELPRVLRAFLQEKWQEDRREKS